MNNHLDTATTVPQLLHLRAAQTPQQPAYRSEAAAGAAPGAAANAGASEWLTTTWQQFNDRVQVLSRGLLAAGLRRGDRLALIAPVSVEWELLHHAALGIGVVVVGLDAHDLPARLAAMVELADITAFAASDLRALADVGAPRWARTQLVIAVGASAVVSSAPNPGGNHTLPPRLTLDALLAQGTATPASAADGGPARSSDAHAPGPDDLATIIFTSGTTGAPKGIAYTHGQVCLAIGAICDAFDFTNADSRLLCWLPLSNLFQRIVNLAALRKGAATSMLSDPRRVMDVVAAVSPDVFVGVPRFYEKLYDGIRDNIAAQPPMRRALAGWAWGVGRRRSRLQLQGRAVPSWLRLQHGLADRLVLARVRAIMGPRLRCMVTGSAPAPRHLLEEFHALGWLVLEAYGLSENVMPMAMNRLDAFRFGTVGRPLPGNDIAVAEDGVLKVRGPGLFAGYLGDERAGAVSPFDADSYYRTGDFGTFDTDGYLRLTGRTGDLIKTSTGRRVAPVGIEAVLRQAPGVDQVMVLGTGRKGLVGLCTVTVPSGTTSAREALEAGLRQQAASLGEHERPLGMVLLAKPFSIEQGELTPNLKLRRNAIETRHAAAIDALYALIDKRAAGAAEALTIIAG